MKTRGWPDGDNLIENAIRDGVAKEAEKWQRRQEDKAFVTLMQETKAVRIKMDRPPMINPPPLGKSTRHIRKQSHETLRVQLWTRDSVNGSSAKCHWCPQPLTRANYTMDHVIALADNGPHKLENLVIACRECNERRGREDDLKRRQRLQGHASKKPSRV